MSIAEPLDAFDKIFASVQSHFNRIGYETSGALKFDYVKGLNIHVLATVGVMLMKGVGKLDITRLDNKDLDKIVKGVNYDEFEPYILYIMGIDAKPKQLKKARMYADYQTMFVRYIYVLRQLNARVL